jgi:hypothetical protein
VVSFSINRHTMIHLAAIVAILYPAQNIPIELVCSSRSTDPAMYLHTFTLDTYTPKYILTCTCTIMYSYIYIDMYKKYIHTGTYVYVYIYVCIYIYKYTCTACSYVLTIPDSSPLFVSSEVPLRDGLHQALESQRLQGAWGKRWENWGIPSIRNGGNHGISMGKW